MPPIDTVLAHFWNIKGIHKPLVENKFDEIWKKYYLLERESESKKDDKIKLFPKLIY